MLHYQVRETIARVGKNKGKRVYYAQPQNTQRLTPAAIEQHLVSHTTLALGDVRHAIASLTEVVCWGLSQGLAVDLGDLGTFKVVAQSKQVTDPKDANATSIKRPQLRFFPKQKMRDAAQSVSISVVHSKDELAPEASQGGTSPTPPSAEGSGSDTGDGRF